MMTGPDRLEPWQGPRKLELALGPHTLGPELEADDTLEPEQEADDTPELELVERILRGLEVEEKL